MRAAPQRFGFTASLSVRLPPSRPAEVRVYRVALCSSVHGWEREREGVGLALPCTREAQRDVILGHGTFLGHGTCSDPRATAPRKRFKKQGYYFTGYA